MPYADLSGATMYHGFGPSSPAEGLGEVLTAAEELRRYRNYLIAAKSAASAAQTQAQRDYASKLSDIADSYKQMYLSRGDADLSAVDRIILSVGESAGALGSGIGNILKPLIPVAIIGIGVYAFFKAKGSR